MNENPEYLYYYEDKRLSGPPAKIFSKLNNWAQQYLIPAKPNSLSIALSNEEVIDLFDKNKSLWEPYLLENPNLILPDAKRGFREIVYLNKTLTHLDFYFPDGYPPEWQPVVDFLLFEKEKKSSVIWWRNFQFKRLSQKLSSALSGGNKIGFTIKPYTEKKHWIFIYMAVPLQEIDDYFTSLYYDFPWKLSPYRWRLVKLGKKGQAVYRKPDKIMENRIRNQIRGNNQS